MHQKLSQSWHHYVTTNFSLLTRMKLNQFDFIISFFMNPALDELIHVHEFLQGTKNSSKFNYNFYNIWMLKNRLRSQFSNVAKWCCFTNTVQMGKRKSLHIKVHHRPLACLVLQWHNWVPHCEINYIGIWTSGMALMKHHTNQTYTQNCSYALSSDYSLYSLVPV